MRIKLDENIPSSLADWLRDASHDADTVHQEGLTGKNDATVWEATQTAGRFFITQDLDFSDLRRFKPGAHHGLLLVRLTEPSRRRLIERVQHLFEKEAVETWWGCTVIVTERKIRVRRHKD